MHTYTKRWYAYSSPLILGVQWLCKPSAERMGAMMQYVGRELVEALFNQAEMSERRRVFHRFHAQNDMLNRVLIVGTSGSYVAPHRHTEKFEAFSAIEGGVIMIEFDDAGTPINAYDMQRVYYVELAPMTWHTLLYTTDRWAVMEYALWKQKYDPADKEFAPWAPAEGDPKAPEYLQNLTAIATDLARKH